jgi:hypothetical protein
MDTLIFYRSTYAALSPTRLLGAFAVALGSHLQPARHLPGNFFDSSQKKEATCGFSTRSAPLFFSNPTLLYRFFALKVLTFTMPGAAL